MDSENLDKKNEAQYFWINKNFFSIGKLNTEFIESIKDLGSGNLGSKNFGSIKILDPKSIRPIENFGSKTIESIKNFGSKIHPLYF